MSSKFGKVVRMTKEELETNYPGYDAGCYVGNSRVVAKYKNDMTQEEYDAKKEEIKQIYIKAIKRGAYIFDEREIAQAEERAKAQANIAT